jgi:hypothetical protein
MSFDDDSFRKIQEPEYSADVSFSSTSIESYMVGNDENEESEQFLPDQLQDYSFNLEEFNEESRKEPEEPEESSEEPDEESDEESEEEFEEEFEEEPNEEESEIEEEPEEEFKHFPNEAYADLMELIVKHDLNNKAGDAIIKFFNKHSNLSVSPLPKNIKAGRKYMNKMSDEQSPYYKHLILNHNNIEYFVYYRPIKNCIQKLLLNPKLSDQLLYNYELLEVHFNLFFLFILLHYLYTLFIYRLMVKNYIVSKIPEIGGKGPKLQYHLLHVFYQ